MTATFVLALPASASAEDLDSTAVGERAVKVSYEVAAASRDVDAADARVDRASSALLPRLGLSASYTRLSDITPPALFPFSVAITEAPMGTAAPGAVSSGPLVIPPVLDEYSLDAALNVPLSDYIFRLTKELDAAKHARDGARWQKVAAESRLRLAGKLAFFEWLRAVAAVDAAKQTLREQEAHLVDVKAQLAQSAVSQADALRVEAATSSAEASLAEADAQGATADRRLRTVLHLDDPAPLTTRERIDEPLASLERDSSRWVAEAYATRAELRALEALEAASRSRASSARAAYIPTIGAFAKATYANPNERYFPPESTWHGTWAAGVAATWAPTDIPGARASATEAEASGDHAAAERGALRDALVVEVVQSLESARAADARVSATGKQLASASEAYRVTRVLFDNARATTSNVLDSDADLARARLAWINARIDARVARARLDHATGRDQRAGAVQ